MACTKTPLLSWVIDLCFLSLAISLFYFYGLGSYPLFIPDEGRYAEAAREMLVTSNYITPHVNGVIFLDKPILFYWLEVAAIKLFGLKEWALRFFPTIAGLLTCLSVYVSTRLLYNRRTAFFAAIILATSPLFFACSHYINLDLETAFWISLSLLAFITGVYAKQKSRLFFLLMYISSACAFLTKGLIGAVFPFSIALAWIGLTKKWFLLRKIFTPFGMCMWFLIVAPWFYVVQKANPYFFSYYFLQQHITRFLSTDVFNNRSPFWFYLPIIALGCLPWSIFLWHTIKNSFTCENDLKEKNLFFLLWPTFIICFFSFPKSKIISYILPAIPPLAVLIANYLHVHYDRVNNKIKYFAIFNFGMTSVLLNAVVWWLAFELGTSIFIYAIGITIIYLCCLCMVFLLRKSNSLQPIFLCYLVAALLSMLTLVSAASEINQNSSKKLALLLKVKLKREDEVISYFKHFQDLPLYLEQYITVVYKWNDDHVFLKDNWARELSYGNRWHKVSHLIDEKKFKKKWGSNRRVFVFLNKNYLLQFNESYKNYVEIARDHDIILLCNQPIVSADLLKTHNLLSKNVKIGKVANTMNNAIA